YDGTTFATLATDIYKPAGGLLRDPSIMHAADGWYYVAYTTAWDGHSFGVARSRDLTHWDFVGDVDIGFPGITNGNITNVWAPEWLKDRDGQVYIVVSLSKSGTKGPFGAYLVKAVDLATAKFEAPVAMDGLQGNYIDTFPVVYSQSYGAFVKNETTKSIEFATADKLTGPWTIGRRGDWAGWGTWIEGPAAVPVKNASGQEGVRVYFDDYITKRYWYSDSFDGLRTWTKRAEVGGVSGAVRHFTVIAETTAEVTAATVPQNKPQAVTSDRYSLMIDGKREMIWAGEFHPFRLPSPSLWRDIFQKMKATGYNAVSLSFDWGYHSSAPGQYDFSGVRDMEKAIRMAEEEGLYVIARPGPYVSAELTMGGFPGYLARQTTVARSDDPAYLREADAWMTQIDAVIARHQITTGAGKVIAVQIENEPGRTDDSHKRYMQHLADKVHADGVTVPIFDNSANHVPGSVDLYAFDGHSGGGCSNTVDPGTADKVPNRGIYGEVPGFAAEIGGGGSDFWGSVGTYDCTAKRTGSGYVKTQFGSSLVNGLSLHSVHMAFGGTSWGWLPASVVYTSYDDGAGIDEARNLRDKQYTLKQMGQFAQAATPLLSAMDKAAPLTSSSPNVKLYHNRSPQGHGDLVFAIHEPSDATGNDTFAFDLTTRDGSYHLPQVGSLRVNGQDAKLLVADYALERQH
ncbi:MAG: beta-galactosidase, partial [Asticcacaulis sp.]|nr:beta-galactosidase [Asticcacaulis sp.]